MRYLPHTEADRAAMLRKIGATSVDELFADVPASARLSAPVDLPPHASEMAVERHMSALAKQNLSAADAPCFLGAGAYRHHVPAAVDHLIQRSEFLTSYTPYQPEVSQGTLQYLFEFQTQVAMLTGMEVANASLYDGASACAEAVLMAARVTRRHRAVLAGNLHPQYRDVVRTMTRYSQHMQVDSTAPSLAGDLDGLADQVDDKTACVVVQNPDAFGNIRDLRPLAQAVQAKGALLVVVVTEILSLGAVMSPGEMGADIVVAEGQSLGNPLGFGGPYLGLFAAREKFVRQMPGRLAGETVDADGRRGYVLTLSTREQHIRREKATSNICTNAGLCSLAFTIHLSLLGERGLRDLAGLNMTRAAATADALVGAGCELLTPVYFNEFAVRLKKPAAKVVDALADFGVLAGVPASRLWPDAADLADVMLVAATETVTDDDIAALVNALKEVQG